jgi:hypothetical protein
MRQNSIKLGRTLSAREARTCVYIYIHIILYMYIYNSSTQTCHLESIDFECGEAGIRNPEPGDLGPETLEPCSLDSQILDL